MNTPLLPQNGPIAGIWNDGKSAASHEAALFRRPHNRELRICPAGSINDTHPLTIWPMDRVRILSGSLEGKSTLPLRLADSEDAGQRLTVREPEARSVLASWLRGPQKEHKARNRRRWVLGAISVWAVCIVLYLGSPALFSFIARFIPQSWEENMGKSARDSVVDFLTYLPGVRGINQQATQSPQLGQLLARLEKGAPTQDYTFDLLVLDADFVNAFALPGGYMLVSTGLIKACKSPDELAGVMAHEMGHVTGRHGTGRLLREQVWAFFIRLMSGSDSMAAKLAGGLVTSSFDRNDERDADTRGVERLVGSGINPMGLADFFARLEKEEQRGDKNRVFELASYLASHPELGERRENIRRDMEEAKNNASPAMSPALSAEEWQSLRQLCGLPPDSNG